MQPSLRLAELLCGRLCHELSSPLGTLAGVMELLTEGGATGVEARVVADEAAVAVRARLRLLRAAWSNEAGPMDAAEIRSLAEGLRTSRRVNVELDKLQGHFSSPASRILLNLLLLGVESLAGNGTLRAEGNARHGVTLTIEGPRAAWPEALSQGLSEPETAWAALDETRTLQAPLTAILARQAETDDGIRLEWVEAAEGAPAPLRLLVD